MLRGTIATVARTHALTHLSEVALLDKAARLGHQIDAIAKHVLLNARHLQHVANLVRRRVDRRRHLLDRLHRLPVGYEQSLLTYFWLSTASLLDRLHRLPAGYEQSLLTYCWLFIASPLDRLHRRPVASKALSQIETRHAGRR